MSLKKNNKIGAYDAIKDDQSHENVELSFENDEYKSLTTKNDKRSK